MFDNSHIWRRAGKTAAVTVSAIAITASISKAALAQDSSDDAGQQSVTVLDTIIIQGEKFPREIFTTFTSVEVVTSEQLDDYVRETLNEALNSSPNIRAFNSGTGNTDIVIRGLSTEGATQPSRSNPAISVTVDGAEQGIEATRRGTRGVWDVEQIEVLRGPQSTLQGRNALAGSVVITTKDPTWEPEARIRGLIGTDDLKSGAFVVSAPIVDNQLAFRMAGEVFRGNNDITYADPALDELGEDEFEEFRGKILWEPDHIEGLTGLFTISRTHDKPAWNLVNGPNFFDREFSDPGNTIAELRDTYVNRYIADLSYEINPDWKIQSVTAYVDTNVKIDTPETSTLQSFQFLRDDTRDGGDLSQDIRLTYNSPDSPFSGVFGAFAGRFTTNIDSNIQAVLDPTFPYIIPYQDLQAKNKSESLAIYADTRYDLMDRWTFLAGGRLLYDKVSADYSGELLDVVSVMIDPFAPAYVPLDESSSVSNTEFLPKIGLAFELTDNQNIAGTISKGYRPGFSEIAIGTTGVNNVEAEKLWAYELAYRSKWLEDRLQINGNIFYYDYTNQQIPVEFNPVNFPGQTITVNAAESHSYGAEIEARWNNEAGLELFAGLGLLKTEFDKGDFAGNEFPEAPAMTASFGGIWRHESGFFAGGDLSFTDGFYSKGDLTNSPTSWVDSFTIVNAQLGYETENFSITAFAKNLFDEEYLTALSGGGAYATVGEGQSFGLRVEGGF